MRAHWKQGLAALLAALLLLAALPLGALAAPPPARPAAPCSAP